MRTTDLTLLRGLDVVELLGDREEMSAAELCAALRTPRATVYRTLAVLQRRGYVTRSRASRTFRLGPSLLKLGARARRFALIPVARPALAELREATGETVSLAIVEESRIVYAEILDSFFSLRPSAVAGQEVAPHSTAIGKSVLAAMPARDRQALLAPEPFEAFTANTVTSAAVLERVLEETRARGYALDREETEIGASCVAAVILAPDGTPVAALSVSGLTARMPEAAIPPLGEQVRAWAARISDDYARIAQNDAAGATPAGTKGSS
jgi:DNA-binding IclR family transcriptional regulator